MVPGESSRSFGGFASVRSETFGRFFLRSGTSLPVFTRPRILSDRAVSRYKDIKQMSYESLNFHSSQRLGYEELLVLHHLLRTRQVTLTAKALDVSLSVASRLLNRARKVTGDELFVRTKDGLIPTQRMMELAPKVSMLLSAWSSFAPEEEFDPLRITQPIRILCADNALPAFLSKALPHIAKEAPNLRIVITPPTPDVPKSLRNRDADFAIFPALQLPAECHYADLPQIRMQLLMRRDHPLAKKAGKKGCLTMDQIADYPLVVANPNIAMHPEEAISSALNMAGNPFLFMPYFTAAPTLLPNSDFIVWCPNTAARFWTDTGVVTAIDVEDAAVFTPRLMWHECVHRDPVNQWVRGMILHYASHADKR